jgi:hypothetical protein
MTAIRAVLLVALTGLPAAHADSASSRDTALDDALALLRDQRITTTLRADYFQSSRTLDGENNLSAATVQVKALPRLNDTIDGKLEARFSDDLSGPEGGIKTRLLEGFATIHYARMDLRVGRQVIAWGRADGINPTDNITPRDYTVLLPFDDDQRFGATALLLNGYPSQDLTLTLITTPFFQPSQIALPPGAPVIDHPPARTVSGSELALKVNHTGGELDWSISYFHGSRLLPYIRPAGAVWELYYPRISVVGADFARNFGRFGVRGEMAYTRPEQNAAADPNTTNPRVFWVLGIDRTFFDDLNINLQVFEHLMQHYRSPTELASPSTRIIATENAIIDGQASRISNGITFRVNNKWINQTLEAEVFAVANFAHSNYFVRPLVSYAFNDHLKGTVGAEIYRGAGDTQYGLLRPDSGAFAELRYGF